MSEAELTHLKFSATELDRLCGLEITSHWIGSPWAGAYRLGFLRGSLWPKTLLLESLMLGLGAIVALPLALGVMLRSGSFAMAFSLTLTIATLVLALLRHLLLWRNRQRWRSLLLLLEEVDRFHRSLEAAELLRSLDALSPSPVSQSSSSPRATVEALRLTRDSLVTGLMTERLLRSRQPILSRCHELLSHLEDNWMQLSRLEAERQASREGLQESLEISAAVREELRSLMFANEAI